MLRRITKVVLPVAFVTAMVASGPVAFARSGCRCYILKAERLLPAPGGCHFDQSTLQCVSVSCSGSCF